MAPLDEFQHKLLSTVFSYLIPAMVVAGLIGLFKKDAENWIVRKLRALIHGTPKPATAVAAQDSLSLDDAPCCPECRRPMTKRTARKGDNRGAMFWGCTAYPKCLGTRPVPAPLPGRR